MKSRRILASSGAVALVVVVALAIYLVPSFFNTRLTFKFQDAVSHAWVWNATATLEGREIRSFYQSSTGSVDYTFTHLKPGKATLEIKAPNYETVKIPVTLHIGRNRLSKPVEMVGYRIPGLTHFVMIESQGKAGLSVQMRPVDTSGQVITEMPCLNLWVGALVSAELKGNQAATTAVNNGARRGATLFRGRIPWTWDPAPSTNFRYNAEIPYAKLSSRSSAELVVDYLVIVPDPRKISAKQISALMKNAPALTSEKKLRDYLDRHEGSGRFRYYLTTSWNVPGPAAATTS